LHSFCKGHNKSDSSIILPDLNGRVTVAEFDGRIYPGGNQSTQEP